MGDLVAASNPQIGHHRHALCNIISQAPIEDLPSHAAKSAGDIMLVVKRWLADDKPHQIICVAPAAAIKRVLADATGLQPAGVACRRKLEASDDV